MKNNRVFQKCVAVTLLLGALAASDAKASFFSLPQLDTTMTDPIFKTFAAGLAFKPLEPASDLGKLWGFYAGAEFTITSTSAVSNIISGLPGYFPTGDLQAGIGLPFGLTFEGAIFPSISIKGTSFARYAGAIKWTATRSFLSSLPIDLALQLAYTNSSLNYSQSASGGTVNVSYGSSIESLSLLASRSIGIGVSIEPYAGLGLANQSASITASGTGNLFGSSFPAGTQSVSTSGISGWLEAGALLKLGLLGITGEYDYLFGISSGSLKLTFRF
jgi:hypothetical protein